MEKSLPRPARRSGRRHRLDFMRWPPATAKRLDVLGHSPPAALVLLARPGLTARREVLQKPPKPTELGAHTIVDLTP